MQPRLLLKKSRKLTVGGFEEGNEGMDLIGQLLRKEVQKKRPQLALASLVTMGFDFISLSDN